MNHEPSRETTWRFAPLRLCVKQFWAYAEASVFHSRTFWVSPATKAAQQPRLVSEEQE
jgi:hypothetical protein